MRHLRIERRQVDHRQPLDRREGQGLAACRIEVRLIDNILISFGFIFLVRNMNYNEINDLTFKSDRLLASVDLARSRRRLGMTAI